MSDLGIVADLIRERDAALRERDEAEKAYLRESVFVGHWYDGFVQMKAERDEARGLLREAIEQYAKPPPYSTEWRARVREHLA